MLAAQVIAATVTAAPAASPNPAPTSRDNVISIKRNLLATHCAACGRDLTDSLSVEKGMGPICRGACLSDTNIEEALRPVANRAVYAIALTQEGPGVIPHWNVLRTLGFAALADRIADRLSVVRIQDADAVTYRITVPTKDLRLKVLDLSGAKAGEEKSVLLPKSEKPALCSLLLAEVPEQLAEGPKGLFVVRKGWKALPEVDIEQLKKLGSACRRARTPRYRSTG